LGGHILFVAANLVDAPTEQTLDGPAFGPANRLPDIDRALCRHVHIPFFKTIDTVVIGPYYDGAVSRQTEDSIRSLETG
jgi:hypothetical protein